MFRGESLTIKLKPRLVSTYLTEIKPCLLILSGKKKKKNTQDMHKPECRIFFS